MNRSTRGVYERSVSHFQCAVCRTQYAVCHIWSIGDYIRSIRARDRSIRLLWGSTDMRNVSLREPAEGCRAGFQCVVARSRSISRRE